MPRAEIYRDEYGVPHIHAQTDSAALFALGYAQAQDRIGAILENYRMARGELAGVLGAEHLEADAQKRLLRIAETARGRYPCLPHEVRALVEAYCAGINLWMNGHPDALPAWASPAAPQDAAALCYWLVQSWNLGMAQAKLALHRKAGSPTAQISAPHNSNQWAVSPEHSADGCAMLLIDPHVPWTGMYRWYEAHLHGSRIHVAGFGMAGLPFILLGYTSGVAWAATAGGADSCDLVEERLDAPGGSRYRYGDRWLHLDEWRETITVQDNEGTRQEQRTFRRTRHGPIIAEDGARAWVMRSAYEGELGTLEQLYAMNTARDMGEFRRAMAMNWFVSQNIMAADTAGNTWYVQQGRCPRRPEGYDCFKPMPGWLPEAEWGEPYALEEMPQIMNPPYSRWMQNCNVTPMHTTPEHAIDHRAYPKELLSAHVGDYYRPRGFRASFLLHRAGIIGLEEAQAIALDTYVVAAEPWIAALRRAEDTAGTERSEGRALRLQALEILERWDGYARIGSVGPAVFKYWRMEYARLHPEINAENEHLNLPRSAAQQADALTALETGCRTLLAKFGRLDIPWGDVMRVRRGSRSLPLAGDAFSNLGMRTLRASEGLDQEPDGRFYGAAGCSCTTIVLMKAVPEAYSVTPWGQSDDPASPHYFDQAELTSRGAFKPMWFGAAPDLAHMRRTDVLEYR